MLRELFDSDLDETTVFVLVDAWAPCLMHEHTLTIHAATEKLVHLSASPAALLEAGSGPRDV